MGAAPSIVKEETAKPVDASDVDTPRGESAKAEVRRLRTLLHSETAKGRIDMIAQRAKACESLFLEQAVAGKKRAYGVTGRGDYEVGRDWSVVGHVESLSDRDRSSLRVLDVGTGSGDLLASLYQRCSIPWDNLFGITAEDLRASTHGEGIDQQLPRVPDSSYLVANLETLPEDFMLQNEGCFDLILSDMTFCWLSDPMVALQITHRLLADNGLMVIGSVPCTLIGGLELEEEQRYFNAVVGQLRRQGHAVTLAKDPVYASAWFVLRKHADAGPLDLFQFLEHAAVNEEKKVEYRTNLEPANAIEVFGIPQALDHLSTCR